MFTHPIQPSSQVDEGTVVAVDVDSSLAKVKTLTGQSITAAWLSTNLGPGREGDRSAPSVGTRVMLHYGLGTPVIIGSLPRIQTPEGATPVELADGSDRPDTGTYGPSKSIKGDQNKPADMVQGDRVISSVGGAVMAAMRSGTVLLRGGRTAEIILSKLRGLVRVVSRNWEHFTDVSSDVIKNYSGSVYRYTGYAQTFPLARVEDYRLNFYWGNVAAAEQIKTNYSLYSATGGAVIAPTTITYKEQITDGTTEKMRRTLDVSGNQEIWITVDGTIFTRMTFTGNQIQMTWKDQHTVTLNDSQINLHRSDGADVNLDATGIQAQMIDTHVTMTSDTIQATSGTPTVTMNASTITATTGTPTVTMDGSTITATTGDPSVNMTSSEIQATVGASATTLTSTSTVVSAGAATVTLDASQASLMYGPHGVIASAAGVALI